MRVLHIVLAVVAIVFGIFAIAGFAVLGLNSAQEAGLAAASAGLGLLV